MKFADRAARVRTKVSVNEVVDDSILLQRAYAEISRLRKALSGSSQMRPEEANKLRFGNNRLRTSLQSLQVKYKQSRNENEKLRKKIKNLRGRLLVFSDHNNIQKQIQNEQDSNTQIAPFIDNTTLGNETLLPFDTSLNVDAVRGTGTGRSPLTIKERTQLIDEKNQSGRNKLSSGWLGNETNSVGVGVRGALMKAAATRNAGELAEAHEYLKGIQMERLELEAALAAADLDDETSEYYEEEFAMDKNTTSSEKAPKYLGWTKNQTKSSTKSSNNSLQSEAYSTKDNKLTPKPLLSFTHNDIGAIVRVYKSRFGEWYRGTVIDYRPTLHQHRIRYDEITGESWHNLRDLQCEVLVAGVSDNEQTKDASGHTSPQSRTLRAAAAASAARNVEKRKSLLKSSVLNIYNNITNSPSSAPSGEFIKSSRQSGERQYAMTPPASAPSNNKASKKNRKSRANRTNKKKVNKFNKFSNRPRQNRMKTKQKQKLRKHKLAKSSSITNRDEGELNLPVSSVKLLEQTLSNISQINPLDTQIIKYSDDFEGDSVSKIEETEETEDIEIESDDYECEGFECGFEGTLKSVEQHELSCQAPRK